MEWKQPDTLCVLPTAIISDFTFSEQSNQVIDYKWLGVLNSM